MGVFVFLPQEKTSLPQGKNEKLRAILIKAG
jgi:hypothetical protein